MAAFKIGKDVYQELVNKFEDGVCIIMEVEQTQERHPKHGYLQNICSVDYIAESKPGESIRAFLDRVKEENPDYSTRSLFFWQMEKDNDDKFMSAPEFEDADKRGIFNCDYKCS